MEPAVPFSTMPDLTLPWRGGIIADDMVSTLAAPVNNCSNINTDTAECNLTCCNFGNGCIVDFSKRDLHPWRVMPPWQLALFGVGVACETIPGIVGNVFVIAIILSNRPLEPPEPPEPLRPLEASWRPVPPG
ncbi:uncharacterized protein LOC119104362 [Pollicipes pollicipes]|uniref:uncharacterized protein LOC119104362 n=1 Tax=Pollicipes pollicipes TaxID=41117 RepID=UPI001884E880|nr:uncharacterized protein LOC119104362 [Pollicipes pollicipes]